MTDQMAELLRKMPVGQKIEPNYPDDETRKVYSVMIAYGWISENIIGKISITQTGLAALSEYDRAQDEARQKAAAQAAEEKRRIREQRENRAHDWRVAIIGAIIAGLVVLVVSLLVKQ